MAAPPAQPQMLGCPVVVWEWMGDRGFWRPYEPGTVEKLEEEFGNQDRDDVVEMVNLDASLRHYKMDFKNMEQIRTDTGTRRHVKRVVYSASSAPGSGVYWEWQGDYEEDWTQYDLDCQSHIEEKYQAQKASQLNLQLFNHRLPYTIDFATMTQTRQGTGFPRVVRRSLLTTPYPAAPGAGTAKRKLNNSLTSISTSRSSTPTDNQTKKCTKMSATGDQALPASGALSNSLNSTLESSDSSSLSSSTPATPTGSASLTAASPSILTDISSTSSTASGGSPAAVSGAGSSYPGGARPKGGKSKSKRSSSKAAGATVAATTASASSHDSTNSNSHTGGVTKIRTYVPTGSPSSHILPAIAGIASVIMSPALPVIIAPSTPVRSYHHDYGIPKKDIKPIAGVKPPSAVISYHPGSKNSAEEILKKYITIVDDPPKEDCPICCELLTEDSGYEDSQSSVVYKLGKCGHIFHKSCLHAMYESGSKAGCVQCPTCKAIYGIKCGNQPSGTMDYFSIPHSLPGYWCGTICINYSIPPGIQGPEHPQPGKKYSTRGFPRRCFLPNNKDGQMVLKLLIVAWERRLIFTIGQSSTTGEENTVTWNEIHHKTEFGTNHSGHGYPDPNYITNILAELAVQGVTEADLDEWIE